LQLLNIPEEKALQRRMIKFMRDTHYIYFLWDAIEVPVLGIIDIIYYILSSVLDYLLPKRTVSTGGRHGWKRMVALSANLFQRKSKGEGS